MKQQLNDFDPAVRAAALETYLTAARETTRAEFGLVNLHAHTFFSYNAEGYSPTGFAVAAHERGLNAAGIVDFDVLDGLDEFLHASRQLNLRGCVGIESRVFVPELAPFEINSPGEPGIAYHMGVGFTTTRLDPESLAFLAEMRATAEQRNRELIARVNAYLDPVQLDFARDVAPLTPAGNATERHICHAYARRAADHFQGDAAALAAFWSAKCGPEAAALDLPSGPKLQALVRAKTMKRGGVGYVQPAAGSFPTQAAMNRFILAAGAIPTIAWLDGGSAGEQQLDTLLDVALATGVAAIALIPFRNYDPKQPDARRERLYQLVETARRRALPLFIGTEMNSPGLPFVDDIECEALAPLAEDFRAGAYLAYAHTVLQHRAGLGLLSPWAQQHFLEPVARNEFYSRLGQALTPATEDRLGDLNADLAPDEVLRRLR
ncbi:MAG: hypothetical protein K9N49_10530 [Candidatus Marinimicrobia bacterium]|nr:hypothetical protein [Candidatus Neomarinimicrobiota bacterium]